jgi:hypothetical protein
VDGAELCWIRLAEADQVASIYGHHRGRHGIPKGAVAPHARFTSKMINTVMEVLAQYREMREQENQGIILQMIYPFGYLIA